MQVLYNLIEILAHDFTDYYDWVYAMISTTKDDFSASVKTAVKQSLKKIHYTSGFWFMKLNILFDMS